MTRRLPLLVLALLTGCMTAAPLQRTLATAAPVALSALPAVGEVDVEALAAAHDQDDAVYLRLWTTDEHSFGPPRRVGWTYIHDRLSQYVVLDPEAEWVSTTTVRVDDGERLVGYVARVTTPDGAVSVLGVSNLAIELGPGRRLYKAAFPGIVRGSVVEEYYRVEQDVPPGSAAGLSASYALQYPAPVQALRVRFVTPTSWDVQVKEIAAGVTPASETVFEETTGQRVLEFARADVPAYRDEPFSPYFRETAEYAEVMVTRIGGRQAMYESAKDWRALGGQFSDYAYSKKRFSASPVAAAVRAALPDRTVADSLKLAQIVGWVQTSVEVGDPPGETLNAVVDKRRGNPLQLCGLTQAMLDEVGIESEFLLIHPTSAGYFDESFVSSSQVSIPAVGATVGGVRYVVFPFLKGLPISYVPEAFQGARAVRITEDGFGGYVQVPSRDRDAYAADEAFDIAVGADGRVTVEETKTLRGIAAYATRSRFRDLEPDEREAAIRELVTYTEGEVEDLSFDLVRLGEVGTPFEVRVRYAIANAVTVTPEEVLFQTGGLLSPASLGSFAVDTRERTLPIRIYYDQVTHKTIRITYPQAWSLTTPLDDVETANRFGSVAGRYRQQPGEVVAEQSVTVREAEAPADAYGELIEVTGDRSALYVPTLVFEVGR